MWQVLFFPHRVVHVGVCLGDATHPQVWLLIQQWVSYPPQKWETGLNILQRQGGSHRIWAQRNSRRILQIFNPNRGLSPLNTQPPTCISLILFLPGCSTVTSLDKTIRTYRTNSTESRKKNYLYALLHPVLRSKSRPILFFLLLSIHLSLPCGFGGPPPCDPAKMRRIPIRHLAGWLFPGTKDMERSRTGGEGENEGEQRLLSAPRGATSHWRHRVWVRVCAREIEGGRNGCLRACLRLAEVPEGSWPHGKIGKEVLYHLWTLS